MPELRQNPITKQWVIIATERARRPHEFAKKQTAAAPLPSYAEKCPFCPGNEHMAPPETFRIGRHDQWDVRVIPNKFAALSSEGEVSRATFGLNRTVSGVGVHEVVVETTDHSLTTALLPDDSVAKIVTCYKDRYFSLTNDPRIQHVTIFKNHGEAAGTSLEHPHSQIIATPIIPPDVRNRVEEGLRYFDETGECIFCKVLMEEMAEETRVIHQTEHFVAFLPFASLTPFAQWIYPRRHMASFGEIQQEEIDDLARMLRVVLAKLYHGLSNPDFNYVIRTAPSENRYCRYYHWYISIIPRLTKMAGFELGSGMYINTTLPEANAEFLRGVQVPPVVAAPAP